MYKFEDYILTLKDFDDKNLISISLSNMFEKKFIEPGNYYVKGVLFILTIAGVILIVFSIVGELALLKYDQRIDMNKEKRRSVTKKVRSTRTF